MNEEKRPGGLTALAVINFVICGLGILGLFSSIAMYAGWFPTANMTEEQKAPIVAFQNMGTPKFVFMISLGIISNLLLLLAGIGYLKQKKFMGRYLGNAYGFISIVSSIISALWFTSDMGGGFSIGTIIGLIYPVLTLILLNTTFKDDLTN